MTSDETLHLSATRPVLVVTVVHHPEDARIRHREIAALLDAGIPVTYAASFTDHDVHPGTVPGLTTIDLPRAVGRRRLRAARAARAVVRRLAPQHGAVIVHDPELLVALAGLRLPHLIWDVHEDTAAAIEVKGWLPPALRRPASAGVRLLERAAERSRHLLLAEPGYADRFSGQHVVVPNTTTVPATVSLPQSNRVVYLGSVTVARGAREGSYRRASMPSAPAPAAPCKVSGVPGSGSARPRICPRSIRLRHRSRAAATVLSAT